MLAKSHGSFPARCMIGVSILIMLEDAREDNSRLRDLVAKHVSILIMLEDAREDVQFQNNASAHSGFNPNYAGRCSRSPLRICFNRDTIWFQS